MSSIFSKIVTGEVPAYKIAEDENYLAFLDVFPIAKGHTLVIPKKETDYIFDLEPTHLGGLIQFAQKVAKAIDKSVECKRVGLAVVGLEVPHAHIHLIPLETVNSINFSAPKLKFSKEEMEAIASKIISNL